MSIALLQAASELQSSVQQGLSFHPCNYNNSTSTPEDPSMMSHTSTTTDGRPTKRIRRSTSTYERKQIIRRIDRAVQSLLEVLLQEEEEEQEDDLLFGLGPSSSTSMK